MPNDVLPTSGWLIAGLIVLAMVIYGLRDLLRFSGRRTWAISSVCFTESMRRRVLWITPLGMLGVVVVSQLQHPFDAQDAIRQTTKFCLFATGLLVTMAIIILAATNLPREIDNRVIYTVVTKPPTRLEIILGKVIGFARVSALILLIMGIFSLGYLNLRAWSMRGDIQKRLAAGEVDPASLPTLRHYAEAGLLSARKFQQPQSLQIFAHLPQPDDDVRWINGAHEQAMQIPFMLSPELLVPPDDPTAAPGSSGLVILARLKVKERQPTQKELEQLPEEAPAMEDSVMGPVPLKPATAATRGAKRIPPPTVSIQITDADHFTAIGPTAISSGSSLVIPLASADRPAEAYIPPAALVPLLRGGLFYVQIDGNSQFAEYGAGRDAVALLVPPTKPGQGRVITALANQSGKPGFPLFAGRSGTHGQQLRGGENSAAVAVLHFAALDEKPTGPVPFEMRLGIERSGSDAATDNEDFTRLVLRVRDSQTGKLSEPLQVQPESNRLSYISIPANYFTDGAFDLVIQCLTPGHWPGFGPGSVLLVAAEQSFAWNLVKSLLILWLFSVLVIVVAIFCSTFVSWPIAVVLTLVILLAHWGVLQLGDTIGAGIGRQVATDLFRGAGAAEMKVVSEGVEYLTKLLRMVAAFLPDVSRFAVSDDIERGVAIEPARLLEALKVVGLFGVPLTGLAYVFLRRKEVAP